MFPSRCFAGSLHCFPPGCNVLPPEARMILSIHRTGVATAGTILHKATVANEGGRIAAPGRNEA
ncbi:hypothetical protein GCM10011504_26850 [Siccirubricoccus deserti]|nr:hypothetical protein GCM10011504_26850 [Siccirubricoccus deserti]